MYRPAAMAISHCVLLRNGVLYGGGRRGTGGETRRGVALHYLRGPAAGTLPWHCFALPLASRLVTALGWWALPPACCLAGGMKRGILSTAASPHWNFAVKRRGALRNHASRGGCCTSCSRCACATPLLACSGPLLCATAGKQERALPRVRPACYHYAALVLAW